LVFPQGLLSDKDSIFADSSSTGSVYYTGGRIPAFQNPIVMHDAPGWRLSASFRCITAAEKITEGNYHSRPELRAHLPDG
jgi:hypothetical protein